jgi:hypothetical protein
MISLRFGQAPARGWVFSRSTCSRTQTQSTDALSSTVNLNVDLDVVLAVLAQALTAALRARLPGYATVTPGTIQRRFLETPGQIITTPAAVTVRLDRRAISPVLRSADLPPATPIPWWQGRPIRYEFA